MARALPWQLCGSEFAPASAYSEQQERASEAVSQVERELRTLEDACRLIDEWEAAYRELEREFRRLEHRCQDAEFWAEQHEFMRRHLDPFLPDAMQDQNARAADPKLYAAIATLRQPAARKSPFDEMALDERDPFG